MRERSATVPPRATRRRAICTIDVVVVTPRGKQLAIFFTRLDDARTRDRVALPWDVARAGDSLDEVARRTIRAAARSEPAWMEQIGAFGDGRRHPGGLGLSVAYVAVVAHDAARAAERGTWLSTNELPPLAPRQRLIVEQGLDTVRARMDLAPIAFRLLPEAFTLSELQDIYELLLGRPLHKASFRRALQSAFLVEPTDEWRSEGRGRPAQLFRYAPHRRKGGRRSVRFDLLG